MRHRDLVRIDAGLREDHAEQGDVGLRPADDADAMSGEFIERFDLGRRMPLRSLRRQAGWRPQHDDVLAQDDNGFRVGRQVQIAARNRELGLTRREQRDAFRRPFGGDRRETDRVTIAGEDLGEGLDQLLVITARRPHGDTQDGRPQGQIQRAGSGPEQENARCQDEERNVPALPPPAGNARIFVSL